MTTPSSGHVGRVADPFRLTGDSHADLDRMANACAPTPADPRWLAAGVRREELRELIDAAATVFGVGAVEAMSRLAGRIAEDAWSAEQLAAHEADRVRALLAHLDEVVDQRDRARSCAVALEQAIAADADAWTWAYLQRLEEATSLEMRERFVAEANEHVAAAAAPPAPDPASVLIDAPGLPVVDDATLDEQQLVFRRGDETVAVGKIDRLFAPLDTATEIALGATQEDGPPGGETVQVLDDDDRRD